MTTSPDTILAAAEDERHTLLAQAAREHLSNVRAETRRYEEDIRRIEAVFRSRTASQPDVPGWITENRKADIATALSLVETGSADVGQADREFVRSQLAMAASEPGRVYDAWIMASQILLRSKS